MRESVALIDRATHRAGSASVTWVYKQYRNADLPRFVLDKLAQLAERPAMQRCPLAARNRYPVADAAQLFQSDSPTGAFCLNNDAFADTMIDITSESGFLAPTFLKQAACRLGTFGLQAFAQTAMPAAQAIDLPAEEESP